MKTPLHPTENGTTKSSGGQKGRTPAVHGVVNAPLSPLRTGHGYLTTCRTRARFQLEERSQNYSSREPEISSGLEHPPRAEPVSVPVGLLRRPGPQRWGGTRDSRGMDPAGIWWLFQQHMDMPLRVTSPDRAEPALWKWLVQVFVHQITRCSSPRRVVGSAARSWVGNLSADAW